MLFSHPTLVLFLFLFFLIFTFRKFRSRLTVPVLSPPVGHKVAVHLVLSVIHTRGESIFDANPSLVCVRVHCYLFFFPQPASQPTKTLNFVFERPPASRIFDVRAVIAVAV